MYNLVVIEKEAYKDKEKPKDTSNIDIDNWNLIKLWLHLLCYHGSLGFMEKGHKDCLCEFGDIYKVIKYKWIKKNQVHIKYSKY